ncbi:unnamed protein product [Sphagnum tenellum]
MPLVGQNNGILLAYELEDVSPHDHSFQLGMPDRCPPYPEVGDVVIVRNSSDRSFSMAVVRSVSTPTFTTDSQIEEESKRKAIVVGPLMQQDNFVDDKSVRDQFKGLLALQEKGSSDSFRSNFFAGRRPRRRSDSTPRDDSLPAANADFRRGGNKGTAKLSVSRSYRSSRSSRLSPHPLHNE